MDKIIIGIHGLANKPPKEILEDWWKQSIIEGLQVNEKIEAPEFNFKMVYWADLLYKNQQHQEEHFSFDKLYNKEPYVKAKKGALKSRKTSLLDIVRAGALDVLGDTADYFKRSFRIEKFEDWVLKKVLRDLSFYYNEDRKIATRRCLDEWKQTNHFRCNQEDLEPAKKVLRDELAESLLAEKDKKIMLIAHSMGSIIAYDVLRNLGRPEPQMDVSHFVTIGSPLGIPFVKGKIIRERDYDPDVRTPSIVTESWINYADPNDVVAIDVHLRGDYGKNSHGVRVEDDLVDNDYIVPGDDINHNAHKSYGYLRTPEMSSHIRNFLY